MSNWAFREYSSVYVKTTEEELPGRWMSPEALSHQMFSEKSYVWSFGILMWEILKIGNVPFGGLSWSSEFIINYNARAWATT